MLQQLQTVLAFAAIMLTMSVLITALVQIASSLLNLRGGSLFWGLRQVIRQVVSEDGGGDDPRVIKALAIEIITHPAIFAGWKRIRNRSVDAISKEDLYRILEDVAGSAGEQNEGEAADDAAGPGPKKPDAGEPRSKQKLTKEELLARARALALSAIEADEVEPSRYAALVPVLVKSLAKEFPDDADHLKKIVEGTINRASKLRLHTEKWFDSVMDRASERFTACIRVTTIIFAFLVAFGGQVDSISIYDQLANDAELRARVVQGVNETLKKAEESFEGADVATKALRQLGDDSALAESDRALLLQAPGGLESIADGEAWIQREIQGDKTAVMTKYDGLYQDLLQARIESLAERAKGLEDDLARASVKLVPDHVDGTYFGYYRDGRHVLGMLMTALLLSLGSPFWFNLLRSLSNLRPQMAEKLNPKGSGKKKEKEEKPVA